MGLSSEGWGPGHAGGETWPPGRRALRAASARRSQDPRPARPPSQAAQPSHAHVLTSFPPQRCAGARALSALLPEGQDCCPSPAPGAHPLPPAPNTTRKPTCPGSAHPVPASQLKACLTTAPGGRGSRAPHLPTPAPLRLPAGVWGPPDYSSPEAESDFMHGAPLPCCRRGHTHLQPQLRQQRRHCCRNTRHNSQALFSPRSLLPLGFPPPSRQSGNSTASRRGPAPDAYRSPIPVRSLNLAAGGALPRGRKR